MNAFEFGYVLGATAEKTAAKSGPAENTLRTVNKVPPQIVGGLGGGLVGVGAGLVRAPGRGLLSVARGVDQGARVGTKAMDKVLGGSAKGIAGKTIRLPAQVAGGVGGAAYGAVRAPFSALVGIAKDTVTGARLGAQRSGAAADWLLGDPARQELRNEPSQLLPGK